MSSIIISWKGRCAERARQDELLSHVRLLAAEGVRAADWYIESPFVHLRYYLESWFDDFFAWIKFFYVPELCFTRKRGHRYLRQVLPSDGNLAAADGRCQHQAIKFHQIDRGLQRRSWPVEQELNRKSLEPALAGELSIHVL